MSWSLRAWSATADIEAALERQRTQGGILGEHLIAMGKLDPADLERVMGSAPPSPRNIEETGLSVTDLLNLVAKAMYNGAEMPSQIGGVLKLPQRVIQLVLEQAKERKMLDVLGSTGAYAASELRYALTEKGRQWAVDAMAQNQYLGPAPVPLARLAERIQRQRITNERVDRASVDKAFDNLIVSEEFIHRIGPAINSGRSILLYGPPGNGKTSVAERIGSLFNDTIYIPYCFEVEGQIIKVFDPGIHKRIERNTEGQTRGTLRREDFDLRWVPCRRPFIVTGGELTLEMLDLSFNHAGQVLRGAAARQSAGRHLHDRRFRPPARQPRGAAQSLDRAARKPGRISEAPHRQELLAPLRRAGGVLDQPRAARPDGSRPSCAASPTSSR